MKYWLEGGITGIVIVFLLFLLLDLFRFIVDLSNGNGFSNIIYYLGALGATTLQYGIIAFIIGAIIGLIIGRNK